jgi:branched-chain amino acid transport system substrate-binding protein
MSLMQLKILYGLPVLLALASPALAAEIGVTSNSILFGQAAAMSGPSSALGQKMRLGILAAFAEINAKGGVHGRRLELISRDDGYDPDRSVAQTVKLLNEDKVFALIGAVGTPTSLVTVPIAKDQNVPFIGPFTGAGFLRDADLHNVVNIRASYGAEAEAWIKHLTEDRHVKRIAIFYQDDSYGRDVRPASSVRWKSAAWSLPRRAPTNATPRPSAPPCAP